MDAWAALLMAHELLHYHPVDDLYEDWVDRIVELVRAAGGSPAPSLSLPRPPPATGDVAHGAPPPLQPQDGALAPRRAAPRRDPLCPAPVREERSCQEVPRLQQNAPPLLVPPCHDWLLRQVRAPPAATGRGPHQDQAPPPRRVPVTIAGCRTFTPKLRSVAWPGKFKPDLPPRYDDTPDPKEFL